MRYERWGHRAGTLTHLTPKRDQAKTLCGLRVFLSSWTQQSLTSRRRCAACDREALEAEADAWAERDQYPRGV